MSDEPKNELHRRVEEFCDPEITVDELRDKYQLRDKSGWSLSSERTRATQEGQDSAKLVPYLYRPFDLRWIYYSKRMIKRPVIEIMRHMFCQDNKGLITSKQIATSDFRHSIVTNCIVDIHVLETAHANPFLFPLYLYPELNESEYARSRVIRDIQDAVTKSGNIQAKDISSEWDRIEQIMKKLYPEAHYPRFPNFHPAFINDVQTRLKITFIPNATGNLESTFGPEDIFHYIYAILNSPTYRKRYEVSLKIDFPRVPLISNLELFTSLCSLGKALVDVHLLRKDTPRMTSYPVQGDHLVDKIRYTEPGQGDGEGRVWINKKQYFKGVPPEVWNFQIGGYQVCEKWLKDRKGRTLFFDDLEHYQRIVSALAETIRIMGEIDAVIEDHGGFPIQ